jgi:hypothetical protein
MRVFAAVISSIVLAIESPESHPAVDIERARLETDIAA